MSALPPLNRGSEPYRTRVEIWSKQIAPSPPPGQRGQQRSLGHPRQEGHEVSVTPVPSPQQRRSIAAEPRGNAGADRAVSIEAVRSVVPTTPVELRVAYGLPSVPVSLELVPVHEATTEVAIGGSPALAVGKVHRLVADFYARAPSVGYLGRRGMVGTGLDVLA